MVFNVIELAPDISPEEHERVIEVSPTFAKDWVDYPALLRQAGWDTLDQVDLTAVWEETLRRLLGAYRTRVQALSDLLGPAEYTERETDKRKKLAAIAEQLVKRKLYVACAAS